MFKTFLIVCFIYYYLFGLTININDKIYNLEIVNTNFPCISFIVLCVLAIILAGKKWK